MIKIKWNTWNKMRTLETKWEHLRNKIIYQHFIVLQKCKKRTGKEIQLQVSYSSNELVPQTLYLQFKFPVSSVSSSMHQCRLSSVHTWTIDTTVWIQILIMQSFFINAPVQDTLRKKSHSLNRYDPKAVVKFVHILESK